MKYLLIAAFVAALAVSRVAADEPKPEPSDTNIFVEMQIVEIPRDVALPLLREFSDQTKTEAASAHVQELLDKGTAKLVAWPMVTTHSGSRAVFEAIDELRYASEYSPVSTDYYITTEPGKEGTAKQAVPDVREQELDAAATAFETRNTGVTLEVEPALSADGKLIDLNLVPQHVHLRGMTKIAVEHEKPHDKIIFEQPEFDVLKSQTSLSLKSGDHAFMGAYPAPGSPDHLELFILRAEVRKVR
jgi:Flp pilus assembly secretin CpaC